MKGSVDYSVLPRRIRRGLIEAATPPRCEWSRPEDLPRRIRRGLIEAGLFPELVEAPVVRPSPANSPGPH